MRSKVESDSHWRARIFRRGFMLIFDTHEARALFISRDTGAVNWGQYYKSFWAIGTSKWASLPKDVDGEESIKFLGSDAQALLNQFPDEINQPGTKIISIEVSKPYYANYKERTQKDGDERGTFVRADGSWAKYYYSRTEWDSTEYHQSILQSVEAPNLRAFKSRCLLQRLPCPFPLSIADGVYHTLDIVVLGMALNKQRRGLFNNQSHLDAYRSQLAMLQPRMITVKYELPPKLSPSFFCRSLSVR
jgi:hypothetical protein